MARIGSESQGHGHAKSLDYLRHFAGHMMMMVMLVVMVVVVLLWWWW